MPCPPSELRLSVPLEAHRVVLAASARIAACGRVHGRKGRAGAEGVRIYLAPHPAHARDGLALPAAAPRPRTHRLIPVNRAVSIRPPHVAGEGCAAPNCRRAVRGARRGRFQSSDLLRAWSPFIERSPHHQLDSRASAARAGGMHELLRSRGHPLVATTPLFAAALARRSSATIALRTKPSLRLTLLLSRRLHRMRPIRLVTLRAGMPARGGRAHRALCRAETPPLFIRQQQDAAARFAEALDGRPPGHELLLVLQKAHRSRLGERLARHLDGAGKAWSSHGVEPVAEEMPAPGNRCAQPPLPGPAAFAAMPAR